MFGEYILTRKTCFCGFVATSPWFCFISVCELILNTFWIWIYWNILIYDFFCLILWCVFPPDIFVRHSCYFLFITSYFAFLNYPCNYTNDLRGYIKHSHRKYLAQENITRTVKLKKVPECAEGWPSSLLATEISSYFEKTTKQRYLIFFK